MKIIIIIISNQYNNYYFFNIFVFLSLMSFFPIYNNSNYVVMYPSKKETFFCKYNIYYFNINNATVIFSNITIIYKIIDFIKKKKKKTYTW